MAGIARLVATRLFNAGLTLVVALVLISSIFAVYSVRQNEALLQEELLVVSRQLATQYRDPDEYERALRLAEENLRKRYGISGNYIVDVTTWTFRLIDRNLRFDFGLSRQSYMAGTSVIGDQIKFALKNTLILFTTATIIVAIIGTILGLQMARMHGSVFDRSISIVGMVSWSLPTWWVGILMLLLFAFYIKIFPTQSKEVYFALSQIPDNLNPVARLFEVVKTWAYYMALPLITIVAVSLGGWAYVTRNVVLGVMQEDFVMTARARGLPERRVVYGHVLRTSSPPIITYTGLAIVGSFGGAIITETVFGWPGMGLLYWVAILAGDAPVVVSITWVLTVVFILTILVLDFIYSLLDPRIKAGG